MFLYLLGLKYFVISLQIYSFTYGLLVFLKFPNNYIFFYYIFVNSQINIFMVRENTFSDFSPFGFVKVFSISVNVVCILEKKAYSAVGGVP